MNPAINKLSPEQAFLEGAKQMQSRIAAMLTMLPGGMALAPKVLAAEVPDYVEREGFSVGGGS